MFQCLIYIYQHLFQTHVNLNPHVHFKSEEYFPKASEFLPERWLRGGESSDIHPYLLTPFGHGVRTCAGNTFLLLSKAQGISQKVELEYKY
jgi:cytochrome P450